MKDCIFIKINIRILYIDMICISSMGILVRGRDWLQNLGGVLFLAVVNDASYSLY